MAKEQSPAHRFVSPAPSAVEPNKGITLYVQLANVFRYRILSGAWVPGYRLDNFDKLAAQFKVGRVTVRQAISLLSEEGLVVARRGIGTVVCEGDALAAEGRKGSSEKITREREISINIVSKEKVAQLPPEFAADYGVYDSYIEISKVHTTRGIAFGMMRIFVAQEVFKRFPARAIEKSTSLRLTFEFAPELSKYVQQLVTVEPADFVLSEHLKYSFGSPVAKIMRRSFGDDRKLSYAGISWYRGDYFEMDMELPRPLVEAFPPSLITPTLRTSRNPVRK